MESKTMMVNVRIDKQETLLNRVEIWGIWGKVHELNPTIRGSVTSVEKYEVYLLLICFGTRETIGVRKVHVITKEF